MYELGPRLKEMRIQRGLTQKALARRISKSKSAIASYESDRQMPPLEVLISIAIVFNVSLDYLVGFEKQNEYWRDLTESQLKIINAIIDEFHTPSGKGDSFSSKQIEIIMNLVSSFQNSPVKQNNVVHND